MQKINKGGIKFGDLVLSIVERYLIQCPFLGVSVKRDSTVWIAATSKTLCIYFNFYVTMDFDSLLYSNVTSLQHYNYY